MPPTSIAAAVDFKTPAEIKWVRNASGTNESALLFGDPSKAGPYVVRLKWLPGNMSRPHFHPNDRFFVVLSGTWWVGTGEKFDPDITVPMPAGSYVVHYGGKVHFDGAKMRRPSFKFGAWGRRHPRRLKTLTLNYRAGKFFGASDPASHTSNKSPSATIQNTTNRVS